ncbi:MAG TPA: amidohydrolase family protein [Steroidobacteraceae bacterium]|nr:amidohydrolase family protein [Steroidobacteraceae bacterium]
MIVDAHTHAFPPPLIARRAEVAAREPVFRELYGNPRAKLATAEDVLGGMEAGGVDLSIIAGFAWRDPGLCREHNDELLRTAAESSGRLLAFCSLPLADLDAARIEASHCARAGARGFGELRPESQGVSLADPAVAELLAWTAEAYDLPLLLHASEPVGHRYPGKSGQALGPLYEFILDQPHVRLIAAHWGGGLPFYALMPEVKDAFANAWVDTAATPFLYDKAVFRAVADLIGADHILFGSDFPLLLPESQIREIRAARLTDEQRALVLGGNAARLLKLREE